MIVKSTIIKTLKDAGYVLMILGAVVLFIALSGIQDVQNTLGRNAGPLVYLTAALPGLGIMFAGLLAIVLSWTAESTISIEKSLLELSKATSVPKPASRSAPTERTSAQPSDTEKKSSERIEEFSGKQITERDGIVTVDGRQFDNIIEARNAISKGEI